jgi:hypothetical protein
LGGWIRRRDFSLPSKGPSSRISCLSWQSDCRPPRAGLWWCGIDEEDDPAASTIGPQPLAQVDESVGDSETAVSSAYFNAAIADDRRRLRAGSLPGVKRVRMPFRNSAARSAKDTRPRASNSKDAEPLWLVYGTRGSNNSW